jgi:hypothetical protein
VLRAIAEAIVAASPLARVGIDAGSGIWEITRSAQAINNVELFRCVAMPVARRHEVQPIADRRPAVIATIRQASGCFLAKSAIEFDITLAGVSADAAGEPLGL